MLCSLKSMQKRTPRMSPDHPNRRQWWHVALPYLIAPLAAPVLLFAIALCIPLYFIWTVCLHLIIWSWWCLRGINILFVYSDSPIWHDYIEERFLPFLGEHVIFLNWSQRKRWRISIARLAFRHFGGSREFNPLAVVFRPFRRTRTFRFWQPFRDFKRGHPEALHQMESEFFALIGVQKHDPPV